MPQWPYCRPDQLPRYVDTRVLEQILSDTDDNIDTGQLAVVGSAVYELALEHLKVGAADVDAAVTEAGKYRVDDLVWLADEPPDPAVGEMPRPDHGALLRRLNAGLALRSLQDRRVRPTPEAESMRALGTWAAAFLELVRTGRGLVPARGSLGLLPADLVAARESAVEGIAANVEAGKPSKHTFDTADPDLYPRRMFGRTELRDGDRLDRGYEDHGLSGPP